MKKLSIITLALALTIFVSCKGKSGDEPDPDMTDTITTSVESGASETLTETQKTEEVLDQSSNDELFGTDVDDAAVEDATKK